MGANRRLIVEAIAFAALLTAGQDLEAQEFVVRDQRGALIGHVVHAVPSSLEITVVRELDGFLVPLLVSRRTDDPGTLFTNYVLYYAKPDCEGETAIIAPLTFGTLVGANYSAGADGLLYRAVEPPGGSQRFDAESFWSAGVGLCLNQSIALTDSWGPPEAVLDLDLFVPPFYVEMASPSTR